VSHSDVTLTVALALAAGVVIQIVARTIRVPAIVLLLATGVVLGPGGLGWVRPDSLGHGLFIVVDFAVAVILFEGALNLDIGRLRREERAIRRLVTVGAVVTLAGGSLAARFWLGWPWSLSVLFGSLIVVTGPTVVGPLVRDLRLAVLVLQLTLSANALVAASEGWDLILRLLLGGAVGALAGLLIVLFLRVPNLVHGLENILTLALVMLAFFVSEHIVSQSGLVAVTVAGLVVGNLKGAVSEDLREFKDQLTVLMIGAIFILLAADIGLGEVLAFGWPGVAVLLTLIVVVRPLGVWLSTARTALTGAERAFVAAIAPRGIVAAAIASLTAESLEARGIAGGDELRALVFLVIAGTVVGAGVVAWPLASLLGLRLAARDRVAILGAQGLGFALARELRAAGQTVVFVDADPQRCRRAQAEDFPVIFGDALQERTLRRLPIELVGTAIGVTFNDNLNSQFVRLARQAFGVKAGLVSVDSLDGTNPPEHVARHGAAVLFDGPHDQERWDVRWRQQEVAVDQFVYDSVRQPTAPAEDEGRAAIDAKKEAFVVLTSVRNDKTVPMSLGHVAKPGDRAAIAYFAAWRENALRQLSALGWRRVERTEDDRQEPEDVQ
jgi:NhaP-type Na+/H+ or K+/H+ antiporter